jgi:hypothetical protein
MDNPAPFQVTLLSVLGAVQSVSDFTLKISPENSESLDIFVPRNLPTEVGDEVQVDIEVTLHGYFGRRLTNPRSGEVFPLFPHEFLILSEYLRLGILTGIIFIASLIINAFYPIFVFSYTLPVLLGVLAGIFIVEAFGVGMHVPNYMKAKIIPFSELETANVTDLIVKNAPPPLFYKVGTISKIGDGSGRYIMQCQEGDLEITSLPNKNIKTDLEVERVWIFQVKSSQIHILGILERGGRISWRLKPIFQVGPLLELLGIFIYFLSILPGYWTFMATMLNPLPAVISLWFFVTCMIIGECLIVVGEFARLAKTRFLHRDIAEFKNPTNTLSEQ